VRIAIVGGTGAMGFGLALRLAKAGHEVRLGSRQSAKATAAAARARELTGRDGIVGETNAAALTEATMAILTVPGTAHLGTLRALADPLRRLPVLDVSVPMAFGPLRYDPPPEGSNAAQTLAVLGEGARVVAAFHSIAASLLTPIDAPMEAETLMVGDDKDAKRAVGALAEQIGVTAHDAGPLRFAATIEALTPLLIGMNRRYSRPHVGIRLTGL
jgi:NADPH-dependent F420 reductase